MNSKRFVVVVLIINLLLLSSLLIYNKSLNKQYLEASRKNDNLTSEKESAYESNKDENVKIEKIEDGGKNSKEIEDEKIGSLFDSPIYLNEEKEIVLLNPNETTFRKLAEGVDIDYEHYHDLTSGIVGLYNYDSLEELEANINKYLDKKLLYVYQPDYFDIDGNMINNSVLDDSLRLEKDNIKNEVKSIRTFIFTEIENSYNTISYIDMGEDGIIYLEGRWKAFANGKFGLREPLVYGKVSGEKGLYD